MKEEILRQLELMRSEAISIEKDARESAEMVGKKDNYPFMFGYAVAGFNSAVVRIDTIIELVKQSL